MGGRVVALALVAVACGACGAKLEDNAPSDAGGDAPTTFEPPDAAPDAPPPDARPCEGGDARAEDPSTGSCFVYFTGPAIYADAEAACTAFGARLAVIKSGATNAVVRSLIAQTDAFVGADDRDAEGAFRWLGDPMDPVTGGYTNWRMGEPNNANGNFQEDCMIIEGDQDGTWDDRPCAPPPVDTGAYAYICQF